MNDTTLKCQNNLFFQFSVSSLLVSSKRNMLLNYNIIFLRLLHMIPFFPNSLHNSQQPLFFFLWQQPFYVCSPEENLLSPIPLILQSRQPIQVLESISQPVCSPKKTNLLLKQANETCESLEQLEKNNKSQRKTVQLTRKPSSLGSIGQQCEIKLDYRIQWKNENRNIVPNLINQMISYLLKQSKSLRLVKRIFARHSYPSECSLSKYYQYVKKIRQSITHYVNEAVFLQFLEIHQPNCELYTCEEQLFYMRVCRIVILSFLRNDIKLISLTSKRMSQAKRQMHLIAREALQCKFLEITRTFNS